MLNYFLLSKENIQTASKKLITQPGIWHAIDCCIVNTQPSFSIKEHYKAC